MTRLPASLLAPARLRASPGPRAVAATLLLAGVAVPCLALDPTRAINQYNREVWTTVQDLPQGSVMAIAQTADGYLWFGTRGGLARFDGVSFTVFKPSDSPGLEGRTIQALLAGRDGSLWIGTDGKGIVRYQAGVFRRLDAAPGLDADSGNSLYQDNAGVLWIATWMGVVRFDGTHATRIDTRAGLPHDSVFRVTGDGSGRVWAATGLGLAEVHDTSARAAYAREIVGPRCLLLDSRDVLWVGTKAGLQRIEAGRVTRLTASDGLLADFVNALLEDRDGNVWIGTEGGLNRWVGGRLEGYSAADGLPGNSVASLFEDREGSLWIGLRGAGLMRLREGALTTYTRHEGLAEDNVTCVFQSRDGSLWFGTTHGLSRLRQGRLSVYTKKDGLLNESITGLGEDPGRGVLIATYANKLNVFRGERFGVLQEPTIANSIPSVVHHDRSGVLWIGTLGDGLYRLAGGKVEHFPFTDSGGRSVIHAVLEDAAGVIWFATPNGLLRYQRGRFSVVEVYSQAPNLGVAYALHADASGNLWVGTRDRGLCRVRDGQPTRCFGGEQGLPDETVYRVLEDDQGRLFLSTPSGIGVVALSELEALAADTTRRLDALKLGVADGMKTAECQGMRWPAGWRASDGRIWFPTAKGAVVLDPARLRVERTPPPVAIEGLTVDGVAYPLPSASVAPGRRDIDIRYAGLGFRTPELVRFRYRLDGFDDRWVEVGKRRSAHYTNVPPGRYRFRVTAAQEGGAWNSTEASLELTLRPYFYETRLWFLGLALVGLSLVFLGYRWRLQQLHARAQELTLKVHEALAKAKVLSGLLPICASCKRIRSDKGYWEQIEAYIRAHSEAQFSHGLCPECVRLLYPELAEQVLARAGGDPKEPA
jgi:ligand-binding sensor domain-containing protein